MTLFWQTEKWIDGKALEDLYFHLYSGRVRTRYRPNEKGQRRPDGAEDSGGFRPVIPIREKTRETARPRARKTPLKALRL